MPVTASSPASLFDSCERSNRSPALFSEGSFEFLNRVDSLWWERVRGVLDDWFRSYPPEHQPDLRGRFRCDDERQHWPAWWELYLFRLFSRLGYTVAVHPAISTTSARPDFYVRYGATSGFFVEALTVFSGIDEEGRDATGEARILDAINSIRSQTFCVGVEFEQVGREQPRLRQITPRIEQWLRDLNPDAADRALKAGKPYQLRLHVQDWLVAVEAYPIAPEYRSEPPGRLIAVGPSSGGAVDDVDRQRVAIIEKCRRYPRLERPLVLAVLSRSTFGDTSSFEQALFGSHAVRFHRDSPERASLVRQRDGAWMGGTRTSGRNVSAALTATHLAPWQVTTQLPILWANPWAAQPFDAELPFPRAVVTTDGAVTHRPGTGSAPEILGLPQGWPGPKA